MENKGKVIFLDWMLFVHRSIFAWRNNKQIPPEYTCLNMVLSCLRKIGIESCDDIIVACDSRHSWRKDVLPKEYKANRKAFRESFVDVDWTDMFGRFEVLLEKLDKGTSWAIAKTENVEADDWMIVGCRYFTDREVILVTYDQDLEQSWHYPNVKIFSPIIKFKGKKGAYKIPPKNFNVYQLISKKIRKEVSDNLVNEILNQEDYENRMICVNLLSLPEFIEAPIIEKLKNLPIKGQDLQWIPFQKTIRPKLENLYNDKSSVVTYEQCLNRKPRKKRKKK